MHRALQKAVKLTNVCAWFFATIEFEQYIEQYNNIKVNSALKIHSNGSKNIFDNCGNLHVSQLAYLEH
jgi:hypothetical protein